MTDSEKVRDAFVVAETLPILARLKSDDGLGVSISALFETIIREAGERILADRGVWAIDAVIRQTEARNPDQARELRRIWDHLPGAA